MASDWTKALLFVSAVVPVTAIVALAQRKRSRGQEGLTVARGSAPTRNAAAEAATVRLTKPKAFSKTVPTDEKGQAIDHDGCLALGRLSKNYPFGQYEVCLTPTQRAKLAPKKKLGCGVFACAYDRADGKVVKFTRDSEDVAALIAAQKSGVVPKLYSVHKLGKGSAGRRYKDGEPVPVYAMVVEKLRTIPKEQDDAQKLSDRIYAAVNRAVVDGEGGPSDCNKRDGGDTVCKTVEAAERLKRKTGITWDDAHAGNIGFDKKGRLKILDLGLTRTQLKEQPAVLEGSDRKLAGILPRV